MNYTIDNIDISTDLDIHCECEVCLLRISRYVCEIRRNNSNAIIIKHVCKKCKIYMESDDSGNIYKFSEKDLCIK